MLKTCCFALGEFGDENVLQRTVWWLLALHFGFHARDENRKLKWGDIVLQGDNETSNEIMIWKSERGSKTRRGNGDTRAFNPTAQATNNERCPVYYYKKFKSHRPEEMNNASPRSPRKGELSSARIPILISELNFIHGKFFG